MNFLKHDHIKTYLLSFLIIIKEISCSLDTDIQFEMCRVTKTGSEFMGKISETRSGHLCEYWDSGMFDDNIVNNNFPDGSKRAARNFCRNPDDSPDGPWCYTKSDRNKKENCTVPLCCNVEEDCKTTGPGMEYVGEIQKSVFDNECLHWAATAKNDDIAKLLPEGNLMLAGKSCRNPKGVLSGPWCYVLSENLTAENKINEESWVQEPCDVPTCFNLQQITVVINETENAFANYYTHFSSFNGESEEINFSMRLWNPEDWRRGEVKIALSLVAIPVRGDQLRKWDIGYEITLRNNKGGVTPSKDEEENWEDQLRIMSGIKWAHLKLSWSNYFITLTAKDKEKPFFIHEIKPQDNGIISQQNLPIKYISIQGTFVFWNFSQNQDQCPEHITTSMVVTRYWLMLIESVNKFIEFHLRSDRECVVNFKISPVHKYPMVQLRVDAASEKAIIYLTEDENKNTVLSSAILPTSVFYWKWTEFSISISGRRFYMLVTTKKGLEKVFDINDIIFQGIKWFAIASTHVCHWSLFCKPSQMEYEAMPPECSVSHKDTEYQGHQWITQLGLPCLPWNANIQTGLNNGQFPDGSITAALNYCRNPTGDRQGTYCIAINISKDIVTTKQFCNIRQCRFKDCRIAGTGNDFMGQISTTISGRTCQEWAKNTPHSIPSEFLRDVLFPERSVKAASNYCRDPAFSVGGPYCYTKDPDVPQDLCDIPDCYKPTPCTIMVTRKTSKKVYLVPTWRAYGLPLWIKMWNPNVSTALILNIYPPKEEYSYQIIFGDDENEHIKLNYIKNSGEKILLKQKTHAHFLSSGRWVGIIINMQDTHLKMYYEDTPNPFFTWNKGKSEHFSPINAMYFSYEAKSQHDEGSIGLNFPCDVCQTEICINEKNLYSVYYPMNLWKENSSIKVKNISFNVRGNGTFIVNLYVIPAKYPIGVLSIEGTRVELQYTRKRFIDRVARKNTESPVIANEHWTELILTVDDVERDGTLFLNGKSFMTWKYPRTPLVYFFGIKCSNKVTWVVNCKPPKLDGTPINGGWSSWSPWECSVTCGGGQGVRRRTCSQPEPTLLGKVCEGESVEKGACNEIACGDVTMETINSIRKYLAQQATNIQIGSGDSVELKCNSTLLEIIKRESPKSALYWNQNGVKITNDEIIENIDVNDFKLEITNAKTSKNGVYACIIVKPDEEQEIIDVIALIIKSKSYTITRRIAQKLKLQANTIVLNNVYSDLRLTWFINGEVYKEYDETDLRLIEEEWINPVKRKHEGEWTSVVYQDNLALNWTTSWYKLKVKKKANWATHLLEEDLFKGVLGDNELVIYIIVTILFAIAIAAAAAFTIFVIRLQKNFQKLRENAPNLDNTS